jgi:hypothetical protein
LAPDKKIISRTFKIRGALVFLCPKERGRERESERVRDERASERENKSADNYISELPGPK